MEINYNMLVQNHVDYNYFAQIITLWGGGAMVKCLTPQCGGEKFKSPHLQSRLPSLLRLPHIYNLGYLGYLSDLIT
jgi:hypothetical protein